MAKNSRISWTHHTYNPWVGCTRVSPGCQHCYAELQADGLNRVALWSKGKQLRAWGPTSPRYLPAGRQEQARALVRRSAELAGSCERERVFCASMADVFEDHPAQSLDVERDRLWDLIEQTPNLDWLVLTKRPQNIAQMIRPTWLESPRPNVWLGTTAEDQRHADLRVPELLKIPAIVHFVSCEPLLGAVDLAKWLGPLPWIGHNDRVQWVIAGGESGRGYRHPAGLVGWVHDLREQALKASATFHFKQWGGHSPTAGGRSLDGETWDDFPAGIGSGCLSLVQRIMAS